MIPMHLMQEEEGPMRTATQEEDTRAEVTDMDPMRISRMTICVTHTKEENMEIWDRMESDNIHLSTKLSTRFRKC